jgi:hypothetical protein
MIPHLNKTDIQNTEDLKFSNINPYIYIHIRQHAAAFEVYPINYGDVGASSSSVSVVARHVIIRQLQDSIFKIFRVIMHRWEIQTHLHET